MATPLTDSINALTAYANEVTGQSDTNLSDAVHTLASGYVQGGYAPNGYTRLLYLEASGTQGIDTGKYGKLNSRFVVDANYLLGRQGSYAYIFGSANPIVAGCVTNSASSYDKANSYWSFGNVSDKMLTTNLSLRGKISLDKNGGSYVLHVDETYIRDIAINASTIVENPNSHLCLFCRGNNGIYERFSKCRIYEYWYYEGDTLIQHMIPVKRKSDNVLGMYDLVGDIFYTNIGTGTFIEGAWT